MIGRINGFLLEKHPPWIVVDVHGVGYELEASYEYPSGTSSRRRERIHVYASYHS